MPSWHFALAKITQEIRYPNFKNAAAKEMGYSRAKYLNKVWEVMATLKESGNVVKTKHQPPAEVKPSAFGGVVIDGQNRFCFENRKNITAVTCGLLRGDVLNHTKRASRRHFGRCKRNFGVEAEIITVIPGVFAGEITKTQFLLMRYIPDTGKTLNETIRTRWATFDEARSLIRRTTSDTRRQRDLAVLDSALKLFNAR